MSIEKIPKEEVKIGMKVWILFQGHDESYWYPWDEKGYEVILVSKKSIDVKKINGFVESHKWDKVILGIKADESK